MSEHETIEALWSAHHRLVMDVSYRVLGSLAEAEDVTQETYLRLVDHGTRNITDPRGWLITVAARLSLDRLRSHEHARRAYPGPWLPEPVLDELSPEDSITLDESVRMALLVVLEQLSPAERTAFLLHDVFGLDFASVATVVGRTPQACRQLASRARRRIASSGTARFNPDPGSLRAACERFARACQGGDLHALVAVLDSDARGDFDSGGLLPDAPLRTVHGARPIAERLLTAFAGVPAVFTVEPVNTEPGVIVRVGRHVVTVLTLVAVDHRIRAVHAIGNPAKLRHLQPPIR
jgi:RNA polymerase sigma-70 factor (ECF subfamily)